MKTMSVLINRRIGAEFRYHDTLHWFMAVIGTGTTSLESKMIQQLTEMS